MTRMPLGRLSVAAAAVTLLLAGALALRAQDAAKVAPQAFTVKIDNVHARVLEYRSKPGQKEAMHEHPACVIYIVSGGTLRYTFADGKTQDVELKTGDVSWREPIHHAVENVGKTEVHAILVEQKATAKS